jgi:hypothetical protein
MMTTDDMTTTDELTTTDEGMHIGILNRSTVYVLL